MQACKTETIYRIEDLKSRLKMYVFSAPSDISVGCA
jgi:hypothetical protein